MIESVIFDMDGVLVDSEPFWQDAEMAVFVSVGIHLTRAQCRETTGLPVHDLVSLRYHQQPWTGKPKKQVAEEIVNGVIQRVQECAEPMDGVRESLDLMKTLHVPIALASSSSMRLIRAVLDKLSLSRAFQVIHSAEREEYGKPHPAVFLSTAKRLRRDPLHCLVIEDSFNGLLAAKAARMKSIVIPMPSQWHESRFDIADAKLKSLKDLTRRRWEKIDALS